ncbi:hypothetical protein DDE05_44370 [Streptomyces cavourensis]|nr:hypothetical protein DDE05_44370 [Streptomyces cavourensis]
MEKFSGATAFAARVWGISLRYDLDGQHPMTGRRVSDRAFAFWFVASAAHALIFSPNEGAWRPLPSEDEGRFF